MRPYNRSFVTLKQERSDYSSNDRKSLGRCIIEAKDSSGKISVYVQDLKPQMLYKLYIIASSSSRSTGVPLGTIGVDSKGKGEFKLEFDADNVGGSDLPIESFNVVAVIVPAKNDIIAPLVGYTDEYVIWKNNFWDYGLKAEALKEEVLQEAVLQSVEPVEEEAPVQEIAVEAEAEQVIPEQVINEEQYTEEQSNEDSQDSEPQKSEEPREATLEAAHLAFKDIIHKFNEEIEFLENYQYDLEDAVEEPVQLQAAAYEDVDDLSRIYSNDRIVTPFDRVFQDVEWIQISTKEIVFLDKKYFHYMYLPFVLEGSRRHRHLLLGRRRDEDSSVYKYMLGVPSLYSESDSSIANSIGLKHFICCSGDDAEQGAFGYWMLYME